MRLVDSEPLLTEINNGIKAGNYEEGYENYAHINSIDDVIECIKYADTIEAIPIERINEILLKIREQAHMSNRYKGNQQEQHDCIQAGMLLAADMFEIYCTKGEEQ